MPLLQDEDLFESTKMTFGEHLEELRGSLVKAVAALLLGFLIGLLIGNRVVVVIQGPVKQALVNYHTQRAIDQFVKDRQERGLPIPESEEAIQQMMETEQMVPETAYINPPEIVRELKQQFPDSFGKLELPDVAAQEAPRRENMIRLFLWRPLETYGPAQMTTLSSQEAFMIYIKASLVAGFVLASPFIFYFVWEFVAAGLYPHERRYIHVFMPMSIGLFLAGAALAFFVVFKYVLAFLLEFNEWMGLSPELRISEWMSFVMLMPIGFGLSFQLPLVMLFLERIGVFSIELFIEKWRIAVLTIAIISMILTPADPISMMLMAAPLTVLYFGGILLCKYMPRGRNPIAEALD